MSYTKYVMDGQDKFVMISKYAGMEHSQLALLLEGDAVSAGFVVEMDGKLTAYGSSVSLNMMKSRETDSDVFNKAIEDGKLSISWDNVSDHYFAGNITHISMDEPSQTIDDLKRRKIVSAL